MPFSDWLHNVTLRGCLVAAVLIAVPALGQQSTGQDQPVGQNEQQHPATQPEPSKDDPGASFWKDKQGSADTYRAICDKPKHQSDADLCQQWRVAEAGQQQAKWAFWQFIASAIGSGGIWGTII